MKQKYYILGIMVLILIIAVPLAVRAEDDDSEDGDDRIQSSTTVNIKARMRAEIEQKNKNAKLNQNARNEMLEKQRLASSTGNKALKRDLRDIKGDIKEVREDFKDDIKDIKKDAKEETRDILKDRREDMRNGSSTINKKGLRQELEIQLFNKHKDILVRQLNLTVNNLKQIRERIITRITKAEQSGRNMTKARALLVTADAKITAAQVSITTLANFSATASSTTAATTATTTARIKLDRPRQIGENAIKAVKDAREALNTVVKAIAKDMGLGNATTTPPVTATTTATTTTTTTL